MNGSRGDGLSSPCTSFRAVVILGGKMSRFPIAGFNRTAPAQHRPVRHHRG